MGPKQTMKIFNTNIFYNEIFPDKNSQDYASTVSFKLKFFF